MRKYSAWLVLLLVTPFMLGVPYAAHAFGIGSPGQLYMDKDTRQDNPNAQTSTLGLVQQASILPTKVCARKTGAIGSQQAQILAAQAQYPDAVSSNFGALNGEGFAALTVLPEDLRDRLATDGSVKNIADLANSDPDALVKNGVFLSKDDIEQQNGSRPGSKTAVQTAQDAMSGLPSTVQNLLKDSDRTLMKGRNEQGGLTVQNLTDAGVTLVDQQQAGTILDKADAIKATAPDAFDQYQSENPITDKGFKGLAEGEGNLVDKVDNHISNIGDGYQVSENALGSEANSDIHSAIDGYADSQGAGISDLTDMTDTELNRAMSHMAIPKSHLFDETTTLGDVIGGTESDLAEEIYNNNPDRYNSVDEVKPMAKDIKQQAAEVPGPPQVSSEQADKINAEAQNLVDVRNGNHGFTSEDAQTVRDAAKDAYSTIKSPKGPEYDQAQQRFAYKMADYSINRLIQDETDPEAPSLFEEGQEALLSALRDDIEFNHRPLNKVDFGKKNYSLRTIRQLSAGDLQTAFASQGFNLSESEVQAVQQQVNSIKARQRLATAQDQLKQINEQDRKQARKAGDALADLGRQYFSTGGEVTWGDLSELSDPMIDALKQEGIDPSMFASSGGPTAKQIESFAKNNFNTTVDGEKVLNQAKEASAGEVKESGTVNEDVEALTPAIFLGNTQVQKNPDLSQFHVPITIEKSGSSYRFKGSPDEVYDKFIKKLATQQAQGLTSRIQKLRDKVQSGTLKGEKARTALADAQKLENLQTALQNQNPDNPLYQQFVRGQLYNSMGMGHQFTAKGIFDNSGQNLVGVKPKLGQFPVVLLQKSFGFTSEGGGPTPASRIKQAASPEIANLIGDIKTALKETEQETFKAVKAHLAAGLVAGRGYSENTARPSEIRQASTWQELHESMASGEDLAFMATYIRNRLLRQNTKGLVERSKALSQNTDSAYDAKVMTWLTSQLNCIPALTRSLSERSKFEYRVHDDASQASPGFLGGTDTTSYYNDENGGGYAVGKDPNPTITVDGVTIDLGAGSSTRSRFLHNGDPLGDGLGPDTGQDGKNDGNNGGDSGDSVKTSPGDRVEGVSQRRLRILRNTQHQGNLGSGPDDDPLVGFIGPDGYTKFGGSEDAQGRVPDRVGSPGQRHKPGEPTIIQPPGQQDGEDKSDQGPNFSSGLPDLNVPGQGSDSSAQPGPSLGNGFLDGSGGDVDLPPAAQPSGGG